MLSFRKFALPARAETALPPNTFIAAEAPVQYLAKDRLIGAKVKGPDGKIVGDIEDIILSGDHQVVGVVMGTGGFFGLFEKKVGVEVGAIQFDVIDGKIGATLSTATKDVLEAAPAFVRDHAKKSLFERAVEKTKEIRDKTGTSAKDVYEDVKDKAAPAVGKAKEKAKEALDNAGPAVQKAKEAVKEASKAPRKRRRTWSIRQRTRQSPRTSAPVPAPAAEPAAPAPAAEKQAESAPAPAAEKPAEPAPAPAAETPAAPAPAAEKAAEHRSRRESCDLLPRPQLKKLPRHPLLKHQRRLRQMQHPPLRLTQRPLLRQRSRRNNQAAQTQKLKSPARNVPGFFICTREGAKF